MLIIGQWKAVYTELPAQNIKAVPEDMQSYARKFEKRILSLIKRYFFNFFIFTENFGPAYYVKGYIFLSISCILPDLVSEFENKIMIKLKMKATCNFEKKWASHETNLIGFGNLQKLHPRTLKSKNNLLKCI